MIREAERMWQRVSRSTYNADRGGGTLVQEF